MDKERILQSMGFTVVRTLGKGSFGQVMLVTSAKYSKQVAVKVIDTRGQSPVLKKFLRRELIIIKRVQHPHIVQVHEILKRCDRVFIVMEATATSLLEKIMQLDHAPIAQAKTWFSQIVSAVRYLHQKNIVHRDLKPDNVLLTADDQVKLTDFGFARFSIGERDRSTTFCGAPSYAAPEVLDNVPYSPKKSDVWSLGVILYTMVTGYMPFDDSQQITRKSLQYRPLSYPDAVPVEEPCRAFMTYMLDCNPNTRPTVEEVAQHPWLQSSQEHRDGSEAAGSSRAEAESSAQENVFGSPERLWDESCEEIQQQQQHTDGVEWEEVVELGSSDSSTSDSFPSTQSDADEQITIQQSETKPVKGSFSLVEEADRGEQDDGSSSKPDVDLLQEDDSSRAGVSLSGPNVEEVGEVGCFSCSTLCAAAKAKVVAPILRASRALGGRMKRFFKRTSLVHDSTSSSQQSAHHSAASTEAPASSSSEQGSGDEILDALFCGPVVEDKAVEAQRSRRFPQFKILRKSKKVHPL